jgi:adenylylsulfate kinase
MSVTFWFTGLPCSGKTSIADAIHEVFPEFVRLDGDVIRKGICSDLTFSDKDRVENIRRIAHICQLFNDNKSIVLSSFVSPTKSIRDQIKNIVDNVIIVHVDCSVEECERRDVKGMWKQAREGKIKNWTGIDSPYETPVDCDFYINTEQETLKESVSKFLQKYLMM